MLPLKKFFLFYLPLYFWAWLIFFLSSLPNLDASPDPLWNSLLRNFAHFLFFLVLYLLFYRCLILSKTPNPLLSSLLFVFLYALSDEIHQSFVPTRTCQFADLLLDNLGSLTAAFCLWKLLPKAPKPLKLWAKKSGFI